MRGSTVNVIDNSGNTVLSYWYDDFGQVSEYRESGNSLINEVQYTGAIYDELTGLLYLNARFYDPATGRFISQDTYRGERDDTGTWHLYAYCANDPVNYVDPSGHVAVRVISAAAAGTAFGSIGYLVTKQFNLTKKQRIKAVAVFTAVGAAAGAIFGPKVVINVIPKVKAWVKEAKRTTKVIKPKGESYGRIVILNKFRIMLHAPHLKNPANPHKYMHIQIELFSHKWRIPLGKKVKK